jgi:hypothetical protein
MLHCSNRPKLPAAGVPINRRDRPAVVHQTTPEQIFLFLFTACYMPKSRMLRRNSSAKCLALTIPILRHHRLA